MIKINLKKGIIAVLGANLINMVFNLVINFAQPKFLSIDTYASIKTFQLYCSYVGILHLGYVDGMYLKYGGKDFSDVNQENLYRNLSTLRIFQLIIAIVFTIIGIVISDKIMICFALSIIPLNMVAYYKALYQAVGEFNKYGRIMNANTILIFLINILLIFGIKTDDYSLYILYYTIIYVFIWIVLEVKFRKHVKLQYSTKVSIDEFIYSISNGFFLMLGNFSSTILTSIDRWFIKILFDNISFAQYSFAVSMENFMNIAITPVTITLYNYFCRVKDVKKIKRTRNLIVLFAVTIVAAAFPAKFILEHFLSKYIDSIEVMFLLFASEIFYIIIKSFYVNLYKAQMLQKKYFIKLVIAIIVGIFLNSISFVIFKSINGVAIGTLLSSLILFLLCMVDFKQYKFKYIEVMFILIEMTLFLFCGFYFNTIYGFLTYIFFTSLFSYFIFKNDLKYIKEEMVQVAKFKKI